MGIFPEVALQPVVEFGVVERGFEIDGHFDMMAYQKYFAGEMSDALYDEAELVKSLAGLPNVPETA